MRKTCLLPDGTYELSNGTDILVVSAEDMLNVAATFFAPSSPEELDEARAQKKALVNLKLASVFDGGFTVPSGPMAGSVLQVGTQEDRTNWLTSQASYSTMVALGRGDEVKAKFRCSDNTTHTISYRDGLNVLLMMADWGAKVMARSWVLKDEIAAAPDWATLDSIDTEAGWP